MHMYINNRKLNIRLKIAEIVILILIFQWFYYILFYYSHSVDAKCIRIKLRQQLRRLYTVKCINRIQNIL